VEEGVGGSGHCFPVYVLGVNLEQWLRENCARFIERIRFIKIDAEGFDKEILKSMAPLLRKIRREFKWRFFRSFALRRSSI